MKTSETSSLASSDEVPPGPNERRKDDDLRDLCDPRGVDNGRLISALVESIYPRQRSVKSILVRYMCN